MEINFQSESPVIIQFPRFAGGKFLSNCLSLSKHCVPQDKTIAEHLLHNPTDYNYRVNRLSSTLPLLTDMINWINKYELGDTQLFGMAHMSWRAGLQHIPPNDVTVKLSNSNLKFFIVCHSGPNEILNLVKVWPNATIIMLKGYRKFYNISSKLKSNKVEMIEDHAGNYCEEKYNFLKGTSWPNWEEFENNNYISDRSDIQQYYHWNQVTNRILPFNVDNNIFNKENFLTTINDLYIQLGFDDFNPELVGDFWQRYIALHIDKNNLIV